MKNQILGILQEIGRFVLIFAICLVGGFLPAGIYHLIVSKVFNFNVKGDGLAIAFLASLLLIIWLYQQLNLFEKFSFKKIPFIVFPCLVILWIFDITIELILVERIDLPSIPDPDWDFWVKAIVAVLIAPLFEEMVMRGILLRRLLQKTTPWVAIIVSSLCFGLLHINPPQIVSATIGGIFMGWLYWRTQSLIPGIFLHFINNAVAVTADYFSKKELSDTNTLWIENYEVSLLLMFTALVMSILVAVMIDRILKKYCIIPFPLFQ